MCRELYTLCIDEGERSIQLCISSAKLNFLPSFNPTVFSKARIKDESANPKLDKVL